MSKRVKAEFNKTVAYIKSLTEKEVHGLLKEINKHLKNLDEKKK